MSEVTFETCDIHQLPDEGLGKLVMAMLKPGAKIILCTPCRKRLKASLDKAPRPE